MLLMRLQMKNYFTIPTEQAFVWLQRERKYDIKHVDNDITFQQ